MGLECGRYVLLGLNNSVKRIVLIVNYSLMFGYAHVRTRMHVEIKWFSKRRWVSVKVAGPTVLNLSYTP